MLSRLSITKRVLVWHAIAIPALVLAIALTAHQLMANDIERLADQGLHQRAQAIETLILQGIPKTEGIPRSLLEDHESLAVLLQAIIRDRNLPGVVPFVRIAAPDGAEIIRQGVLPKEVDPKLEAVLPPNVEPPKLSSMRTIDVDSNTSMRLHTRPIKGGEGSTMLYLQVADDVPSTTGRLVVLTLLESALGSIVIIGISTLIIATGLRPLRRIIRHIDSVEASGLAGRIEDAHRPPELDVLVRDLNSMWERLENAFRVRSAFVAGVSHDLRTPLTILQGQIDLLSLSGTLTDSDRTRLERVQREVRHLIRLTNNVLLYTQLDSVTPDHAFMSVDLSELIDDVVRDMRSYALEHTIEERGIARAIRVMGDYDLLKAAFVNVIENAIKYTRPGGHILVSVVSSGPNCTVSIADDGFGIRPEDLPHVTEPYYRGDNREHLSRGGTGLGLTLVERIVRLHRGHLSIDSRPGEGTNVTIELPKTSGVSQGARRRVPPAPRRKHPVG